MASPDANKVHEGLIRVAHSIRRSMALYVAMSITAEGSSEEDLFATADRCATWIRGSAPEEERKQPLGEPFGG